LSYSCTEDSSLGDGIVGFGMLARRGSVETFVLCKNGGAGFRKVALLEESEKVRHLGSIDIERNGLWSKVSHVWRNVMNVA
jgi:hypothetical protein